MTSEFLIMFKTITSFSVILLEPKWSNVITSNATGVPILAKFQKADDTYTMIIRNGISSQLIFSKTEPITLIFFNFPNFKTQSIPFSNVLLQSQFWKIRLLLKFYEV